MKWYQRSGPEGDVVVSTRIRLTRNLQEFPFPARLNAKQMDEVVGRVREAVLASTGAVSSVFDCFSPDDLSQQALVSLAERHLVSPEFIAEPAHRGLVLSKDEEISVMVNEEDHLRIQVLKEGMQLQEAFALADRIDALLNERLNFAYDGELGYLTQCPTNLGTGMRASLMLHLPGLEETGSLGHVHSSLHKLGFVLRGMYGEGTQAAGSLYQLSNQITLGCSESEALENLAGIAQQLIRQEREARSQMCGDIVVQDRVSRSLGLLRSARMLTGDEFMKLITHVRFGVTQGLCEDISLDTVNALLVEAQPATLTCSMSGTPTPRERDVRRAEMVRRALQPAKTE